MLNFKNLLGMVMQSGVTGSGNNRMRHALGDRGMGGQGGMLSGLLGGGGRSGAGGGLGGIAQMASQFLGGSSGRGSVAAGGLGALAGALLGGGGGAATGALGGGVMALLGSMAVSALKKKARPVEEMQTNEMPLGLREPQDQTEEEQLEKNAQLMLRAMINAAKADGQIDQQEIQRITGKLAEVGADDEARNFILQEMAKPLDLDALTREVHDPEIGVQVYTASLLAIEVDTAAEQDYMRRLAFNLGLDSEAVARIHQILDVPPL
jgi:uncharacterized membrane protein YebE (DUF533 family)